MAKLYKNLFTLLTVFLVGGSTYAQNLFFRDVSESSLKEKNLVREISPVKFRTIGTDVQQLKTFLWSLPSEDQIRFNRELAPVMEIPMPNGQMAKFRVWESSIQEPGLAAKFPEIRTFGGQGIDDPYATIRMDYNPYFGFHAQILSSVNGRVYVNPYAKGDVNYYISYYHADNRRVINFKCLSGDEQGSQLRALEPNIANSTTAGPCRGTEMRTYRLAIACTGEYSQAVAGGNAAATHAAIVTSTNRIIGVYQVELAVSFVLIANNNLIEYTVGATDPFVNTINTTLLNANQTNTDNVIGSANYDFGHVFTSDDNGLAQLSAVCGSGKARGATGSPVLVGDGFDIDYVAHEMGHQMGASHTFSSGQCASPGGSYEQGGGTTIMAYAGICAASENLQPNSDAIFHAKSFDDISTLLQAQGAGCGVATPTGNTLPVITSMTPTNLIIPINTPFTLSATATDANGDAITYNWEGWDAGATPAGTNWTTAGASTTRPLFRTRVSKTTGERTFPDPRVIAANFPGNSAPSVMDGLRGEVLPSVARNMKFRVTVRDNRAGGGGVVSGGEGCQISTTFQVSTQGTAPFAVTVPNGGESYAGGSSQTVTWNVSGTDAAPISTANVKISMSTDGGITFPTVLLASTPNDGSESVTIPVGTTTTARIKVEAVGHIFFDMSNANFTVTGPAAPTFGFNSVAPATVACAAASTVSATLATTASGGFSTPITLAATSGVPAGTTVTFGTNPVTPGNSSTVVLNSVNTLAPGSYNVTITGTAGSEIRTQTVTFVVQPGTGPSITSQPSNVSVCVGSAASFSTTATGVTTYQWQVSTDGGTNFNNIAGATSATYNIAATAAAQNGNVIRVVLTGQCGNTTSATATLNVTSSPAITAQPASTASCTGATATFSTTATGTSLTYQWEISTDGGTTWTPISGATAASFTTNALSASDNGNRYRVVIANTCASSTSNAAILTVNNTAVINDQPEPQTICSGSSVSFTIDAVGSGLTYQWQVSTDGGTNWSDIAGATTNTYTIPSAAQSQNGNRYRVQLGSACSATPIFSDAVTLTVFTPVNITSAPPALVKACVGDNVVLEVEAEGTSLTYQWEVSFNGGSTWQDAPGGTSSTYTINNVPTSYDGYLYRVTVSGQPCGIATTDATELQVNMKPGVVLAPSTPNTSLTPATQTTLFATVSPAIGNYGYQWTYNGEVISFSGSALHVSPDSLGEYSVQVIDSTTGCSVISNVVELTERISTELFVYPNPTTGMFQVRYYGPVNVETIRHISVYDSKGARVINQAFPLTRSYQAMHINMTGMNTGLYFVELKDASGKRLGTATVIVK